MRTVKAPELFSALDNPSGKRVFMAGGITGCPNWQRTFEVELRNASGVLFNPRRDDFDVKNPHAAREQIEWEYMYLRRSHAISFWFPEETLCPIVLFELGAWAMSEKPIFVGCHPNYQRRFDVLTQLQLARPDVLVVDSVEKLAEQVGEWVDERRS